MMSIVPFLTPVNLAEAEDTFFSSSHANPVFQYDWDNAQAQAWLQSKPAELPLINALRSRSYQEAVQHAQARFQVSVEPETLQVAQEILRVQVKSGPTPPIDEIIAAFMSTFARLGLHEYRIKVVDQSGFNFRPQLQEKKLLMSAHAQLGFLGLEGEIKHELVHIIRRENGKTNNISVANDYLPTEEGLASFCQDYTKGSTPGSLFQHAAEYAATEVALKGSLRDVFEFMVDLGFPKKLAWQRSIRHKFGWIDTAQPGDLMKPAMYFFHEQKVRQLATDELYRLFVGKISLAQLSLYPQYSGRVSLAQLQQLYQCSDEVQETL